MKTEGLKSQKLEEDPQVFYRLDKKLAEGHPDFLPIRVGTLGLTGKCRWSTVEDEAQLGGELGLSCDLGAELGLSLDLGEEL